MPFVCTLALRTFSDKKPLEGWTVLLSRLATLCPHLRALDCASFRPDTPKMSLFLPYFQEALPEISSLKLRGMTFEDPEQCLMALTQSANLTHLIVDGCSIEDGNRELDVEPAEAWIA